MLKRLAIICFAFLATFAFTGCGRRSGSVQTEEQRVQDLITSAPDLAITPAKARPHFVEGKLPDAPTLRKIAQATLLPEAPRIRGDEATVAVAVRGQGEDVKVEWVLVKDQDQWKIQSAPMP